MLKNVIHTEIENDDIVREGGGRESPGKSTFIAKHKNIYEQCKNQPLLINVILNVNRVNYYIQIFKLG